MKRLTRPLVLVAAALTLLLGAAGITALVIPMPTDAAVGPASAGAGIPATECQARIAQAGHGFSVTLVSLSEVGQASAAERCDAYRAHVAALTSARDTYAACLDGFARHDQLAQIDLATHSWRSTIEATCAD